MKTETTVVWITCEKDLDHWLKQGWSETSRLPNEDGWDVGLERDYDVNSRESERLYHAVVAGLTAFGKCMVGRGGPRG